MGAHGPYGLAGLGDVEPAEDDGVATVDIYVDSDDGTDNTDAGRGDAAGASAYATLAYAITQRATDLTSAGDIHHYHIDGATVLGHVSLTGYTTDASNYVILEAVTRHNGTRGSGVVIQRTSTYGAAIDVTVPYTRIIGLEVDGNSQTGSVGISIGADGDNALIDGCLIYDAVTNGIQGATGSSSVTVRNTAIYSAGADGVQAGESIAIDNCTILNSGAYGVQIANFRTLTIRNTYVGGSTTASFDIPAGATFTDTTCATSDGDESTTTVGMATGSGAYFANVTGGSEDAHIGSSSSLAGAGTDLSGTFTDDWEGDTRSSWDIGADEYVAAGGGLSGSVTEGITMADVPDATATLYAAAVDSFTMADVPTATGIYSGAVTDSVEIDDTPAALLHLIGAMADGFHIDDAAMVTVTLYAQVSDGVAIGDICEITVPGVLSASLSDGITFADTPVARSTLYGQAVDGITFSDVLTGAFYIRGAVTDGITMADSAAVKRILSASATDGITFSDLAASMAHLLAAAVDGITIQDITIAVGVEASGLMTMSATAKGAGITVTARVASMTVT